MGSHLLLVPLLILMVAGPGVVARSDSPDESLDLAAMVLTPADLAAAELDDLGLLASRALAAEDLADRAVWPRGTGEGLVSVHTALVAAGWRQGYAASYAPLAAPNAVGPGRELELEIVAYADAGGAATGFALIPDVFPTGPITDVPDAEPIGDESRVVRVAARDPQAGVPSQELALGFRSGRLTARLLIRDWTGAEPPLAQIETLATRLLARIEHVLCGGESGLDCPVTRETVWATDPRSYGMAANAIVPGRRPWMPRRVRWFG